MNSPDLWWCTECSATPDYWATYYADVKRPLCGHKKPLQRMTPAQAADMAAVIRQIDERIEGRQ